MSGRMVAGAIAMLFSTGWLLAQSGGSGKNESLPGEAVGASGAQMYVTYCAVCHGRDGKGAGPAVAALRQPVPDLTTLSRRSGGTFPSFRVATIIQADGEIAAHGTKEMPMWGDFFRTLQRDEAIVKLRVHNLTAYLESLQVK